jgi:hypothetical protein
MFFPTPVIVLCVLVLLNMLVDLLGIPHGFLTIQELSILGRLSQFLFRNQGFWAISVPSICKEPAQWLQI